MQRTDMAVMPPIRRPGRSLAEPSLAKASQVRTIAQHDWSMVVPPNQFQEFSDANEYEWRPREAPRTKHRDAEPVRTAGVARRSSRAGHSSRDFPSHSIEVKAAPVSERLRTQGSSQGVSRPLPLRGVEEKRPRRNRKQLSSPSPDHQLRALGAWSDASLVRHRGVPAEFLEDEKQFLASSVTPKSPKSPRHLRLPTPELVPVSEDHEFCACCVDAHDEFDEMWYKEGRAKMDAQLESAMAHIATMSSGGRRRLEF